MNTYNPLFIVRDMVDPTNNYLFKNYKQTIKPIPELKIDEQDEFPVKPDLRGCLRIRTKSYAKSLKPIKMIHF